MNKRKEIARLHGRGNLQRRKFEDSSKQDEFVIGNATPARFDLGDYGPIHAPSRSLKPRCNVFLRQVQRLSDRPQGGAENVAYRNFAFDFLSCH